MSDDSRDDPAAASRGARMPLGIILTVLLLAAAVAVGGFALARQAGQSSPSKGASSEAPAQKPESATAGEAKDSPLENPFPDRFPAPSLDGGTGWLNASGEITLGDLRGKVVLLDFWTYCCINCMHVLPDLAWLEKKYANELVVIGVHSAKFDNEKDTANIRRAIQRYEIEHPVINDSKMTLWRKFGARAWPTLVLIDPEGFYCGYVSGEGHRELLDAVISKLVKYHRAKGTLDTTPVRFDLERDKLEPMPLRFPGKVLADEKSRRLFISDSGHNRIVVATLEGELLEVIGTGETGRNDGGFDEATFDHPQGLALVDQMLYVADTENHLVRAVDLKNRAVATLAGTGEKARFRTAAGGALRETPLSSPWALIHVVGRPSRAGPTASEGRRTVDGVLYICMAGPHQIWSHKLGGDRIGVYAGSGREDVLNGPLTLSAFAQPSGITTDGKSLYVADSEGSAIRRVPLDPGGPVTTLVGPHDLPLGRALFEFGDVDAAGEKARLQHPLGVAWHDGVLYVADSYNHKIKRISVPDAESAGDASARVETWLGDGTPGATLDPLRFSEPGGLSAARGRLFVADTNNHRIVAADVKTGKATLLTVEGLKPPQPGQSAEATVSADGPVLEVSRQQVAPGEDLIFRIEVGLPEGYKLNNLAPVAVRLKALGPQELIAKEQLSRTHRGRIDNGTIAVQIPLSRSTGSARIELAVTFGYCRGGVGGLCKLKTVRWQVPVEATSDSGRTAVVLATETDDAKGDRS